MTATALITATAQTALAAQQFTTEAVLSAWAAQLDCKESSRALYVRCIRQFFAWVERSGRTMNTLTRADVLAYRDGLIDGTATADGHKRSPLTTSSYITSVKLFYDWLQAAGVYPNIATDIKRPKRNNMYERKPLTGEQAAELLTETTASASLRDAAIIELLVCQGLRTVEVIRADVGDMQEDSGATLLWLQRKGRDAKDKFVILADSTKQALLAYLSTRGNLDKDAPLIACDSNRSKGGRMTTRSISRIAKQHLQNIGLNSRSYTAHSLRHTYACAMLDVASETEVQRMLGHANVATTHLYTYHREAMDRIKNAKELQIDSIYKKRITE